jgi:hypothetical protein
MKRKITDMIMSGFLCKTDYIYLSRLPLCYNTVPSFIDDRH